MFPYLQLLGKELGTYGICMVLGIFLAGYLAIKRTKASGQPIEDIFIVGAFVVGSALMCGNLLYVVVSYPASYIMDCLSRGNLSFLGTGIVFYGGLIGGIFGTLLGVRVAKCKFSHIVRTCIPYVPLGHSIGRIGCLMAGCCHGMEYDGPFAIYYANSVLGVSCNQGYFPVQPIESLLNVGISVILIRWERSTDEPMDLLYAYLSMYGITRFCLEFLRGDSARGIYWGISVSQWISMGFVLVGVVYALKRFSCKKRSQIPL